MTPVIVFPPLSSPSFCNWLEFLQRIGGWSFASKFGAVGSYDLAARIGGVGNARVTFESVEGSIDRFRRILSGN